ncbi:hypothetical protein D3C87_2146330 [compost metagenome]
MAGHRIDHLLLGFCGNPQQLGGDGFIDLAEAVAAFVQRVEAVEGHALLLQIGDNGVVGRAQIDGAGLLELAQHAQR